MEINHKNVFAAIPRTINAIGRIDGLKKYAGRNVIVIVPDEVVNMYSPIPIGTELR